MRTDRAWKNYGRSNPYFGVLSDRRFLDGQLNSGHRSAFFASGVEYVGEIARLVEQTTGSVFGPTRALDFGCGVGRLLIPFSSFCNTIVGVDISKEMLAEAAKNCKEVGVTNADFHLSDDNLSQLSGHFDFVHTYITLQHISASRGLRILERIVDKMAPDGIAALHITYASSRGWLWNLGYRLRRYRPIGVIANSLRGMPLATPHAEMNPYHLNRVFQLIQKRGIRTITCCLTDHGGFLGALLIFRNSQEKVAF